MPITMFLVFHRYSAYICRTLKYKNIFKHDDGSIAFADIDYMDTWRAMENLVKLGKVKTLGMSNFNHEQMERVIKEGDIKPAVLQVERNPRFTQVL